MKIHQRLLFTTTIVTALFLAFLLPVMAAATENYLLLPGTESPNGKYSLAWGYGATSVDYDKLQKGDEEYFCTLPETDLPENYIVDTAARKIVSKLENSDYFTIGTVAKNHADMLYAWSEDAGLLLYGLSSKWQTDTLDLYKLASDTAVERYELLPVIEKEVRNFLKKKKAAGYKKYGESAVITYSDAGINKAGILSLTASIEVPIQETFFASLIISAQADLSTRSRV